MTVTNQNVETIVIADGIETDFTFDFPLANANDIFVTVEGVDAAGLFTTIYILGDQSGSISFSVAPDNGDEIIMTRVTPRTQDVIYPVGGAFPSKSHEGALDKLTMQIIETADGLVLVNIRLPDGSVENSIMRWNDSTQVWTEFSAYVLPLTDGSPNEVISTDGAGNLIFVSQPGDVGAVDNSIMRWNDSTQLWEEFSAYILPLVDGDPNDVIATDGAGNLVFIPQLGSAGSGILDQVLSSVAGVLSINFVLGQSVFVTMTENITSTVVTGLPSPDALAQIEIEIDQDSTARTWVWPSPITWIGGVEPDLSIANAKYLVRLRTRDAGTSWMGTFGEDFS